MTTMTPRADGQLIRDDWPVEDRRAHERYDAQSYLRAVDMSNGQVLGEIEDISLGGFRLQLAAPLRRGATYAARVEVRIEGDDRASIEMTARNIWMHKVDLEGVTHAGFVFIDLSPEARERIRALLSELAS
jgi:c-di-GMP-binding flagellar brake protein YcgR